MTTPVKTKLIEVKFIDENISRWQFFRGEECIDGVGVSDALHAEFIANYINLYEGCEWNNATISRAQLAWQTHEPMRVYFIQETVRDRERNYIACIAVEGERGFHRLDYHWGEDRDIANQIADEMNLRMGYGPKLAMLVQLRTMSIGDR